MALKRVGEDVDSMNKFRITRGWCDITRFQECGSFMRFLEQASQNVLELRRVEFELDDYDLFLREVVRQYLDILFKSSKSYNEEMVRKFYVNAFPVPRTSGENISRVRRKVVPFDRDTMNAYLSNPYTHTFDIMGDFQKMKSDGYLDYRTYDTNHMGAPRHILRKDITPLTWIWISFILRNIHPVSHTYDLPMTKAYLAFCIQDKRDMDLAAILLDELFRFLITEQSKLGGLCWDDHRALH
ncbi:hypothetical protein Lal_00037321 [Lupinus albus]|nr:hypothetical protein Lal_00037321 [Lupinus albus]